MTGMGLQNSINLRLSMAPKLAAVAVTLLEPSCEQIGIIQSGKRILLSHRRGQRDSDAGVAAREIRDGFPVGL